MLFKYSGVDLVNVISRGLSFDEFLELVLEKMVEKGTLLINYKGVRLLECFEREKKIDEASAEEAKSMLQFKPALSEDVEILVKDIPKKLLSLSLMLGKITTLPQSVPDEIKRDLRYAKFITECFLFSKLSDVLLRTLK